jgi:PAP2 superfamily
MRLTRGQQLIMAASTILVLGVTAPAAGDGFPRGVGEALGSQYETTVTREHRARHRSPSAKGARSWVKHWNEIAIDASGLDHTPVAPGESRIFGEQLGPGRSSQAMAIVHIAMSDAVNAIAGDDRSYTGIQSVHSEASHSEASMKVAIAQAAHDTLVAVFPSQAANFNARLAEDLGRIDNRRAKANGIETGQRAAAAILARRSDDGSQHAEPRIGMDFVTGSEPGMWRQDPISLLPIALGAHWGAVKPFVLPSAAQFRGPPPPALHSPEYAAAFEEVKRLGGDGVVTPTDRTDDQTTAGIYWAYDGTPSLCAPPRLYNQVAVQIAEQMGSNVLELARLLALVNVAMADAGIAIWESKYHYNFWRPVTGIREADEGTGATGAGDGNPATLGDRAFSPLGAPASNLTGPNFTPPFPAYPSGHAGFGGALFQILRRFYGTDQIAFTFVSDEFNGVTRDNNGEVRPLIPRHFGTFSEAEEENGQSRIYLGIHWAFDKTEGIAQGRRVADHIFENAFRR